MAITTLTSSLTSAANNIVSTNLRSKGSFDKVQIEYKRLGDLLEFKRLELERIPLPSQKEIQKLSSINVTNTFGSAGGLLGALAGGALDVGGLVRGFFAGKDEKIGGTPKPTKPKVNPKLSNGKLKIGGVRALGVANALFAGLDFATGLAEGESIGKSAAGTSGSLAGSLLGGVIGQSLIPIPGVGFVLGSMAGGFLGGWAADRVYDASGLDRGTIQRKQEEKLRESSKSKTVPTGNYSETNQSRILNKFNSSVSSFEKFVSSFLSGNIFSSSKVEGTDEELSADEAPKVENEIEMGGDISYGVGNAKFGETGNVSNSKGWVHGHFQGESPQTVVNDTTKVVKALLAQGSPVYLNQPGGSVDLLPSKKYSDDELRNYVDKARRAHTHSGRGMSIDVFVKKGTAVPVPLTDIGPSGPGFGGYGRGGLSGYIQGTRTWIGHLDPKSKEGLSEAKGEIKGRESPNTSKDSPVQTSSINSSGKNKVQMDIEEYRKFRKENFGVNQSRFATSEPQNFQIREMGIYGNKGYSINPLADDTNYEIHSHEGAGHWENRAFDIPVSDMKSGDKVNDFWKSKGYKTLWRVKGHLNHVHVEVPKNKVNDFFTISNSMVSAQPLKPRDISQRPSYDQSPYSPTPQTLIVEKPTAVIASGGGGSKSPPLIVSSGGGGKVMVIQGSTYEAEKNILNKLLELPLV